MERNHPGPQNGEKPRYIRLTPFGKWVSRMVRILAEGGEDRHDDTGPVRRNGYLGNGAYATAAVAKLRHAVGREVGEDPEIFAWTMPPVDDADIAGNLAPYQNGPSPREQAAHAAITLFAVHQQSNHETSAHTDENVSLGRAVGRMAYGNLNESGIRSMFDRLQTAGSWKELVRHSRGLITLLKRERIAINYGLLAQDLLALRGTRNQANAVRTRWGRDFQSAYHYQETNNAS